MTAFRWHDRGSASVLMLAMAVVLAFAGMAATALGAVAIARHQAASAADMAALAAAGRALEGPGPACRAARAVTVAVGATLSRCALRGEVAEVAVEHRPEGWLGRMGSARSSSRAGPAPVAAGGDEGAQ